MYITRVFCLTGTWLPIVSEKSPKRHEADNDTWRSRTAGVIARARIHEERRAGVDGLVPVESRHSGYALQGDRYVALDILTSTAEMTTRVEGQLLSTV